MNQHSAPGSARSAIGIAGVILLAIGVFTPIVRLRLIGTINYFGGGHGDGVFILVLAAISLILILAGKYKWLWLTGTASFALLAVAFFDYRGRMGRLAAPGNRDSPAAAFLGVAPQTAQFEWGWAVLIVGAALLLVCAATSPRVSRG